MVPIITFYNFITVVRKRGICQFTYMHQDTKHAGNTLGHMPDYFVPNFGETKPRHSYKSAFHLLMIISE